MTDFEYLEKTVDRLRNFLKETIPYEESKLKVFEKDEFYLLEIETKTFGKASTQLRKGASNHPLLAQVIGYWIAIWTPAPFEILEVPKEEKVN